MPESPPPDAAARWAGHYQPLVLVLALAAAGIAWDRFWPLPAAAWWCASAVLLGLWCLAWRGGWPRSGSLLLSGAIVCLGGSWHHAWWHLYPADHLAAAAGLDELPVVVEVVALESPRRVPAPPYHPLAATGTGDRSRLNVAIQAVRNGTAWQRASGRTLLVVEGHLLAVHAGDRLRVAGLLTGSQPPLNPGDLDFHEFARAERRLLFLRASSPDQVLRVAEGRRFSPRRWLDDLRRSGHELLWSHLTHQRSGLAAALLLGSREQLDSDRTAAFVRTGTIHVLMISR